MQMGDYILVAVMWMILAIAGVWGYRGWQKENRRWTKNMRPVRKVVRL